MIDGKKLVRGKNKKSVSFWIDEGVLKRWDAFCEEAGITRTQLIMSAVNDKLLGSVSIFNLTTKIDRLAEIVSDFSPDARSRVLEQILLSKEDGIREDDIKGFPWYTLQNTLDALKEDNIIVTDKGRCWVKEFFPRQADGHQK
nr:hypothetical protein [Candidatus Sigynarchaeota archaeon]